MTKAFARASSIVDNAIFDNTQADQEDVEKDVELSKLQGSNESSFVGICFDIRTQLQKKWNAGNPYASLQRTIDCIRADHIESPEPATEQQRKEVIENFGRLYRSELLEYVLGIVLEMKEEVEMGDSVLV